jgi:hypothetical protein
MNARTPLQVFWPLVGVLALAACASPGTDSATARPAGPGPAGLAPVASSAECLAAQLSPAEPFLATAIPMEVLQRRQNGWVAVRYDVVGGRPGNVVVAASQPEGLYDRYALQHAQRYRDTGGKTAKGCVMTIDIKF